MEVLNYIIRRPTCPSISMSKIVSPLAEGIGGRKKEKSGLQAAETHAIRDPEQKLATPRGLSSRRLNLSRRDGNLPVILNEMAARG